MTDNPEWSAVREYDGDLALLERDHPQIMDKLRPAFAIGYRKGVLVNTMLPGISVHDVGCDGIECTYFPGLLLIFRIKQTIIDAHQIDIESVGKPFAAEAFFARSKMLDLCPASA